MGGYMQLEYIPSICQQCRRLIGKRWSLFYIFFLNKKIPIFEINRSKDLRKETISTVIKRVTKFRCWAFVCANQFLFYKMTNIGSWEVSNRNFFIYCCSWLMWVKKTCYFVLFPSLFETFCPPFILINPSSSFYLSF